MKKTYFVFACLSVFVSSFCSCANVKISKIDSAFINKSPRVILGDEQSEKYLPLVKEKRVALFSNHSGILGDKITLKDGTVYFGGTELYGSSEDAALIPFGKDADGNDITYGKHILDFLVESKVNVTAVFCPEHGFRGNADAGALVDSAVDEKTGVPILSLYRGGSSEALTSQDLELFDVLMVDIQDVGLRYYTYYISLYYLLKSCAEAGKSVIILDRPNPNGFYVDGGILQKAYESNVGLFPIPTVHGLTLGELARMLNSGKLTEGEWTPCDLTVIPCKNYDHQTKYCLVRRPSPNLKDMRSVYLYASTCYFENTIVSVGRGTEFPFNAFGSPYFSEDANMDFKFTPQSIDGAKNPPFLEEECYGKDLRTIPLNQIFENGIDLSYLATCYKAARRLKTPSFFGEADKKGRYWIDLLSGSSALRNQITKGASSEEIKRSWKKDLEAFKKARKPYLLYSENQVEKRWQTDVTFPDWISVPNYSANNLLTFQTYKGQGTIYFTPEADCSFKFFINDTRIPMKLKAGASYEVDVSRLTKTGSNIIQLSDIESLAVGAKVRICIPYPVLQKGSLSESGISASAIKLIDKIISADIKNGFPSAQLTVIKDGKFVYQNSWGNIQTYGKDGVKVNAPAVKTETMYDLASVTKMFAGNYAVQLLVDQDRLPLDTKLVDIFGNAFADDTIQLKYENKRIHEEYPLEQIKEWKRKITVRDVLAHTAGFPAGYPYFNDSYFLQKDMINASAGTNVLFAGNDGTEETRQNTLKQIFRSPLVYEPGTKLRYSDIDYMLLAYIVEKISGQRFDEFLKDNFWDSLGLSHMTFNPLKNGYKKTDCAATEPNGNTCSGFINYSGVRTDTLQGEVHDGNAWYAMAGVSGHAGLFSNSEDLARLASLMLTGGYGYNRYFSRNLIELFTSPVYINHADYGLGWWRQAEFQTPKQFGTVCSSRAFGHQGFTGTLVFIEPEENLVIVYLTNKINTTMVPGGELRNQFEGNAFQSSMVGFVPQIIMLGLKGTSDAQFKALLSDMKRNAYKKAEKQPKDSVYWRAYKALDSVKF